MGGAANYTGGIVYFDTFNTLPRNNVLIAGTIFSENTGTR